MEARSVFAMIAILFVLWLIRTWAKWDSQARRALQSRERLRSRLTESTLAGRVRPGTQAASVPAPSTTDSHFSQTAVVNDSPSDSAVDTTMSAVEGKAQARGAVDKKTDEAGAQLEIDKLKARLVEREQDLRRHEHALQEVEKLKKALFERNRENELLQQSRAKSEETLAQFRAGAQRAALLEQQLAAANARVQQQEQQLRQLQRQLVKGQQYLAFAESDGSGYGDSTSTSPDTKDANQASKDRLLGELDQAEALAKSAQQNTLELRRLRSELASVQSDKSHAKKQIEELQARLREQQAAFLSQPRSPLYTAPAEKDDLKQIKGIGPVLERTLNELGVTTFKQLAGFTQHDIEKVSAAIDAFPGRIERDDWVGKAQELMEKQQHPA
jgi:predicted flap endonuclease-1-like 5' DNA nuclease